MVHSDGEKALLLGYTYDVFYYKKQEFSSFMATTSSAVKRDRGKKETEFIGKSETIENWGKRERGQSRTTERGITPGPRPSTKGH